MRKRLYKVSTLSEYTEFVSSAQYTRPNVTLISTTKDVKYESVPPMPIPNELIYTGDEQALVVNGPGRGKIYYSFEENGTYTRHIPTATNAGTYTVYYYVVKNNGIQTAVNNISITIEKAEGDILTSPIANTLTYDGTAQSVATAGIGTGDMYYCLTENGTYTTSIPTVTNAGTYTLYYYAAESTNYEESDIENITITVSKSSITPTVYISNWTYGDTASTPSVLGNNGNGEVQYMYKLSEEDDSTYTSTVPSSAGTYTIKAVISETSNYLGATVTSEFTISKLNPNISWGNSTYTLLYDATTGLPTISNPNSLTGITFSSSDTSVATIDNSGNITLIDEGVTTLSAIFAGNSIYNSSTVTCTLTLNSYKNFYFTLDIITAGTISFKTNGTIGSKTLYYSINDGSWTEIVTSATSGSTVSITGLTVGDQVRLKGSNNTYCAANKNNYMSIEGGTSQYNVYGNIMSLCYSDNFASQTTLPGEWTFCTLFKNGKVVSAKNLVLPATTLTASCYRAMFSICSLLTYAPKLPATTLANSCYWYMFEACTSLETAPDLLATTLVASCYGHMFVGCTILNYIKCLATSGFNTSKCLENWLGKKNAEGTLGVASTGTFVKDTNTTWTNTDTSGIPAGWTVVNAS